MSDIKVIIQEENFNAIIKEEAINVKINESIQSPVLSVNGMVGNVIIESSKDWFHYIGSTKYNNTTATITDGDVLTYTYNPTGATIYRYITTATTGLYPTEDSFYSTFDGTTLSDLITTR
jgi:hypothetical protein